MVLFLRRQGLETSEVVNPLLHRHEARTVEPIALALHNGSGDSLLSLWILRAIFVTGKIASNVVLGTINHRLGIER